MPIYEFKCKDCGNSHEQVLKIAEQFESCPTCQSFNLEKQVSNTAPPKFVGSGFYATDYPKKRKS